VRFPDEMRDAYKRKVFAEPPPWYEGLPYPYKWRKSLGKNLSWQASIYYYWWEFLRRSDAYANLYHRYRKADNQKDILEDWEVEFCRDFGDVFQNNFHEWWLIHYKIFTKWETLRVDNWPDEGEENFEFMYMDFSGNLAKLEIRDLYRRINAIEPAGRIRIWYRGASCKYGVWGRYSLETLKTHLRVWDAKIANPNLHDAEIADLAGVDVSPRYTAAEISRMKREGSGFASYERDLRRAKQLAVQRHLRITRQYIDNLMKGWFPMRSKR
jgi:hypothetical protein